jgi:hypothetical protein
MEAVVSQKFENNGSTIGCVETQKKLSLKNIHGENLKFTWS